MLSALSSALKPQGIVAFTVEKSNRQGSQLHPTGRYSHHLDHIRQALASAGLNLIDHREGVLRNEGNWPVLGIVIAAHKADDKP